MITLDGTTGITTPAETVSGAITASTVTATGLISGSTNYTGFKNRIINGGMVIDQRNAGASVTPNNTYTLDRWAAYQSVASKYSLQQNAGAVTPPVGFSNYLGITSLSAYSILTSDYYMLRQQIEGLNIADLAWGTASAVAVTLSFKVYSSLTGTFGGSLANNAQNRNYPFTYSIPVANTWTTISVTIAGDTTGTWLTTNGCGLQLNFGLGVGATYSGTAGSWNTGNYFSATGATSVVGTSGATFYITGVQLEKGSTATSFDYRPYSTELALCQRYYENSNGAGGLQSNANDGLAATNVNSFGAYAFKVAKRAVPTMVYGLSGGSGVTFSVGQSYFYQATSNSVPSTFSYTASAEL